MGWAETSGSHLHMNTHRNLYKRRIEATLSKWDPVNTYWVCMEGSMLEGHYFLSGHECFWAIELTGARRWLVVCLPLFEECSHCEQTHCFLGSLNCLHHFSQMTALTDLDPRHRPSEHRLAGCPSPWGASTAKSLPVTFRITDKHPIKRHLEPDPNTNSLPPCPRQLSALMNRQLQLVKFIFCSPCAHVRCCWAMSACVRLLKAMVERTELETHTELEAHVCLGPFSGSCFPKTTLVGSTTRLVSSVWHNFK